MIIINSITVTSKINISQIRQHHQQHKNDVANIYKLANVNKKNYGEDREDLINTHSIDVDVYIRYVVLKFYVERPRI